LHEVIVVFRHTTTGADSGRKQCGVEWVGSVQME